MAESAYNNDDYFKDLRHRVDYCVENQDPKCRPDLRRYLVKETGVVVVALSFDKPVAEYSFHCVDPLQIAEYRKPNAEPTDLRYGCGAELREMAEDRRLGLRAWEPQVLGDPIYGRGTAGRKGQHPINLAAPAALLFCDLCEVRWTGDRSHELRF